MKTKKDNKLAPLKPLRGGALARAVVNQILRNPETWDQTVWHSACGTKHCFAGWCQILAGKTPYGDIAVDDACDALGFNRGDPRCFVFDPETTLESLYGFALTFGKKRKDLKPFKD